jgi:hypothetical protein
MILWVRIVLTVVCLFHEGFDSLLCVGHPQRKSTTGGVSDEQRPARVDIRSELKDSFRDLWSGAICCDARRSRADKQEATASRSQRAREPDPQAQVALQGVLTAPQGMSLVHLRGGGMDGHLKGSGLQVHLACTCCAVVRHFSICLFSP